VERPDGGDYGGKNITALLINKKTYASNKKTMAINKKPISE
jgi:hypothetical protein